MKKRKNSRKLVEKEPRLKYQTHKDKILNILTQRSDVTRIILQDLIGTKEGCIDQAIRNMKKLGIRIFPIKGPGTPLRIARGPFDTAKSIEWERGRHLGTIKRMIISEQEAGEQYAQLANKPVELLGIINSTTKENK